MKRQFSIVLLLVICVAACSAPNGLDRVRERQFITACAEDLGYQLNDAYYVDCVEALRRFAYTLDEQKATGAVELRESRMNAACASLNLEPGNADHQRCVRQLEEQLFATNRKIRD